MKITEHKNSITIESEDENGEFVFTILRKKPLQISIECGYNDAYINVNNAELSAIIKALNKVYDENYN